MLREKWGTRFGNTDFCDPKAHVPFHTSTLRLEIRNRLIIQGRARILAVAWMDGELMENTGLREKVKQI